MRKVRWKRADDGFVSSHCGRWQITPVYGGLTRAEWYELWHDGKSVSGHCATQREAKEDAERLA